MGKQCAARARVSSPSAMSPHQATPTTATGRPCNSGWKRLLRRRCEHDVEDGQLFGGIGNEVAAGAKCVERLLPRVDEQAGEHDRADPMGAKLETRDDAEVPTAPAEGPEQVGMVVCGGMHERSVGEHDVR